MEHNQSPDFYAAIFKPIGYENTNKSGSAELNENKAVIEERIKKMKNINIKVDDLKETYIVKQEMKNFSVIENPSDLFLNLSLSKEVVLSKLNQMLQIDDK